MKRVTVCLEENYLDKIEKIIYYHKTRNTTRAIKLALERFDAKKTAEVDNAAVKKEITDALQTFKKVYQGTYTTYVDNLKKNPTSDSETARAAFNELNNTCKTLLQVLKKWEDKL